MIIADRYQLGEQLGEGGMGTVWRAEHLTLKSPVVIKLLAESIAKSPEALERFMREAQASAALRSMHVVQIFDYGVDNGVPYIAMELLQGESMQDRLDRVGRIPAADAAKFMVHTARAMAKAHEAGIIHRDLKPDNIYLVQEDEEIAKVLDFGIAKIADGSAGGDHGSTRTGAVLGTPYYMSPEQAQGTKAIDWRTDLWAMAVIGYQCMTGQRPFDSEALGDLLLKICVRDAPVPSEACPDVPPELDAWFARGVQKDPEDRFQSAPELAEAYAAALADATFAPVVGGAQGSRGFTQSQPGFVPPKGPTMVTTNGATIVDELPIRRVGALPWIVGGVLAVAGAGVTAALMLSGADAEEGSEGTASASAPAAAASVAEPANAAEKAAAEKAAAEKAAAEKAAAEKAAAEKAAAEKAAAEKAAAEKAAAAAKAAAKRARAKPVKWKRPPAKPRAPAQKPMPKRPPTPRVEPKPATESDLFSDRK